MRFWTIILVPSTGKQAAVLEGFSQFRSPPALREAGLKCEIHVVVPSTETKEFRS